MQKINEHEEQDDDDINPSQQNDQRRSSTSSSSSFNNPPMKNNPKRLSHQHSSILHHRRRTIYLIRHGQAQHNVLEAEAQRKAKIEAESQGLSPEETWEKMEIARKSVLEDPDLRDAPLTEQGKQEAIECGKKLQKLIDDGLIGEPTEAMVSPLTRTLQTCHLILDNVKFTETNDIKAHVRTELQERQTLLPPDTARSRPSLFRYTQQNFDNCSRFVMDKLQNLNVATGGNDSQSNFCLGDVQDQVQVVSDELNPEDVANEELARESKEMLRERASKLFDLLMEMKHRHILIVSHKGYLREVERGLFDIPESPLFKNAELRVYRVVFTKGDRSLESLERLV